MNIRNFCFFPMGGNSLSQHLSMARYLWMQIEASGSPMMPILLLEPNRTGYSRWLHRCRLYGGLLEKYRQSMLD